MDWLELELDLDNVMNVERILIPEWEEGVVILQIENKSINMPYPPQINNILAPPPCELL